MLEDILHSFKSSIKHQLTVVSEVGTHIQYVCQSVAIIWLFDLNKYEQTLIYFGVGETYWPSIWGLKANHEVCRHDGGSWRLFSHNARRYFLLADLCCLCQTYKILLPRPVIRYNHPSMELDKRLNWWNCWGLDNWQRIELRHQFWK